MRNVKPRNPEIFHLKETGDEWQSKADEVLDLALEQRDHKGVFFKRQVKAASLARAYPLFLEIQRSDDAWLYVRKHAKLAKRKRLPSKQKRALFATMVALDPQDQEERNLCGKLACVLEEMAHNEVAIDDFEKHYLATTDQACRKAVRARKAMIRSPGRIKRRVEMVVIPKLELQEQHAQQIGPVGGEEVVTVSFQVAAGSLANVSIVATGMRVIRR